MPATVGVIHYTGASGATESDATAGIKWNRSDDNATTAPIPVPTATGTNFSWYKLLALKVTATSTTTINNRRISSAAAPTGVGIMAKDGGATYTQASGANKPADAGTNGNTPTGYTALTNYAGGTNSALLWDNTSVATSATGRNGNYVNIAAGVDNTYAGGGGTNNTAPSLTVQYDEF